MRGEIPMKGGDEYDAFTGWRRAFNWAPGRLRALKRAYRKRARRFSRRELRQE